MKLVKEHINEKFTEQSDPIADMGIVKLSEKEIKQIKSQLKKYVQNLFPHETVLIEEREEWFDDTTYVTIRFKGGIHLSSNNSVLLCASSKGAKKILDRFSSNYTDARIGWYIKHPYQDYVTFVEFHDFDKLLNVLNNNAYANPLYIDINIKETEHDAIKFKKKAERAEANVKTFKIIKSLINK